MTNFKDFLYRTIVIVLLFLLVTSIFSPLESYARSPITINFNGRYLDTDVSPVVRNGRVFLPARVISRVFGMDIRFFPEQNAVAIFNNTWSMSFSIGHNTAFLSNSGQNNSRPIKLDAPIFVVNGRTMLPLRFIAEVFGVTVRWDANRRNVTITSPRPVMPIKRTSYLPVSTNNPNRRKMSPAEVIALIEPATVQIQISLNVTKGSGFVISPSGLVLTNAHVARGRRNLHIAFKNGERFPVQLLKLNNRNDLALLKIISSPGRTFPYIRHRAHKNVVFVGDTVLAFGNPGGKSWVVSQGVVGNPLPMSLAPAWSKDYPLLHHTAYSAPGSSGGAIVNLYGEWVGVHALSGVYEEIGFAIPADYLYELLNMNYFSLNCDWESYWTESFTWKLELRRAKRYFDKSFNAQRGSQEQANALKKAVAITENTRVFAQLFTPSFPELHHLPSLFIVKTEALLAYYTYNSRNNVTWSQAEHDRLWNAVELAKAEYITEFNRVRTIVKPDDTYKASLP